MNVCNMEYKQAARQTDRQTDKYPGLDMLIVLLAIKVSTEQITPHIINKVCYLLRDRPVAG